VNECSTDNGGCTHGCVNTAGAFYCACPPAMWIDPFVRPIEAPLVGRQNTLHCIEYARMAEQLKALVTSIALSELHLQ